MDKDKRKLTEKEIKRNDRFEKLSSEMQQKGYKIKNMIITTQQAKYLGFLIIVNFHSIDFGIIWSSIAPYCTCSEPLKKWQYLLGTAMPTLVLGGGVAATAVVTNQLLLFFLAEYMILSGSGDFLMVLKGMLYHADKQESVYCDHPYECGFVIFEK